MAKVFERVLEVFPKPSTGAKQPEKKSPSGTRTMHAYSLDSDIRPWSNLLTETADAQIVGRMRLLLSISALLAVFVDPSGLGGVDEAVRPVFFAYTVHCAIAYMLSRPGKVLAHSRLVHWLDVAWYGLIVALTGAINSFFFLFFFFAILTSAFRWGFNEGARVTIVSTIVYAACGLNSTSEDDLPRLLLRATFLLALGYMNVYWGQSKLELKRRLALLHDVSQISNPRFGVDQTLATVLEKTRAFFDASSCIFVMQNKDASAFSLRTLRENDATQALKGSQISAEAAAPLMTSLPRQIVVYNRPPRFGFWPGSCAHLYDETSTRWTRKGRHDCDELAELLNAGSFISVPSPLRKSRGRIYVVSGKRAFDRADALFLFHLAAQAFPVIENIELLDQMASEAALHERQKIARDLHDTAIQPYIGLKLGLSALRSQATADNPLLVELDRLVAMAEKVIGDLRRYAGTVRNGVAQSEPLLVTALREQISQVKEFYGIDIALEIKGFVSLNDRLMVEVLQIIREGLSNICKHTVAQRGLIRLQCVDGWLKIEIINENGRSAADNFSPKSIGERAVALGGWVQVGQDGDGSTVVQLGIPV